MTRDVRQPALPRRSQQVALVSRIDLRAKYFFPALIKTVPRGERRNVGAILVLDLYPAFRADTVDATTKLERVLSQWNLFDYDGEDGQKHKVKWILSSIHKTFCNWQRDDEKYGPGLAGKRQLSLGEDDLLARLLHSRAGGPTIETYDFDKGKPATPKLTIAVNCWQPGMPPQIYLKKTLALIKLVLQKNVRWRVNQSQEQSNRREAPLRLQPTPEVRNPEHFSWLCQYQVGLRSYESLAHQLRPTRQGLMKAIRVAADQVGLPLRRQTPPGRPSKKSVTQS